MRIEVRGSVTAGEHDLVFIRPWHNPWVISSLSEHDLRDLEFALALRRAMGRTCLEEDGEHTCSLRPGHGESHQCRGCDTRWRHVRALP